MSLRAIDNCVIVREEPETHSIIHLLPAKRDENERLPARRGEGVVLSVGPLVKDIKVGDYVYYGAHTGQLFRWKGEKLFVMREHHVEGVFTEEDSQDE